MTKSKRFVMKDPNDWGYPITDTDTGKVYSCASNIWMKELCTDINKIVAENEQLKYDRDNCRKQQIRQANKIHEVSDENEQLKQRIKKLEKEVNSLSCGEADWLIEEEL